MKKVLVIVGPTAVGKSDFSIKIAKAFNAQIISGDSIQVYRDFDIASGKISETEKQGVVHHGLDLKSWDEAWSVYDFQNHARQWIEEISGSQKLAMIVGGTGLYVKACLYDYTFKQEEPTEMTMDWQSWDNEALYAELVKQDAASAEKIHPNNRRRVERALTIALTQDLNKSEQLAKQQHVVLYDALILGLTMPRQQLYDRINERVENMIHQGAEQEIRKLLAQGADFSNQPMRGIGYKEWQPYFANEADLAMTIQSIQRNSRQFAKRQYTWFNHQMKVHWIDVPYNENEVFKQIEAWLAR